MIAADKLVLRVLAADVDFACAASAGLRLAAAIAYDRVGVSSRERNDDKYL